LLRGRIVKTMDKVKTDKSLVFSLLTTSKVLRLKLKDEIETEDCIPYELLANIESQEQTIRDLVKELSCSRQEASRIAQRASENGWVTLKPDPEDGRSKIVTITALGRKKLDYVMKHFAEIDKAWSEQLGKNKMESTKKAIANIHQILTN